MLDARGGQVRTNDNDDDNGEGNVDIDLIVSKLFFVFRSIFNSIPVVVLIATTSNVER
jgi:hypothetical protein